MAPEILSRKNYNGAEVDLFAVAVILFIMMSGSPPFMKCADRRDDFYKLICDNRTARFWLAHEQFKSKNFFSQDFKDLITAMLQYNPQHRYDIADIIGHPWMQGPIATAEQVRHEMRKRRNVSTNLVQDHEAEMVQSRASKQSRRNIFG